MAATIAVGEELVRNGHYWEAVRQIEPLLPQARGPLAVRARLALARTCARNPHWLRRAEGHVLEALREEPASVDVLLALAEIYRLSGLPARAKRGVPPGARDRSRQPAGPLEVRPY